MITTPNFTLRKWRLSDAASMAEHANNIRIWENLRDALPHPYSEADGMAFIGMALAQPKPATLLAIEVDGKAAGSIGFSPKTDVERITAELGYWLGEKYWNKGIVTEAVRQTVAYAFANFPELRKIYATPFDFNSASHKVLQKAGFEREAILKQAAVKNGKVVDMHYYSLFKSEWIKNATIRPLREDEHPVLEDLLYEALYLPEGMEPFPRSAIEIPEVAVYIKDFGTKKDDYCMVADLHGRIIGGVWVRILDGAIKGYGNVDSRMPEFAVSLFKEYRNLGVGTALMERMIEYLKAKGYVQASLSVQKENYAVKMYRKLGFETVAENEHDYIMFLKISHRTDASNF